MTAYRTIFTADLVQDSGLNVGGTAEVESMVDSPFCRDGRNRLTLRGEGLGGALVATARRIHEDLPEYISCPFGIDQTTPSRWLPHTTHPKCHPRMEIRRSVGIRQDTGARAEGVLFDLDTTPRYTTWPFLLDVDTFAPDGSEEGSWAERIAAEALLEWQRGRCWLGAGVARGLGWAHLANLKAYRLSTEEASFWPDNRKPPAEVLASYSGTPIDAADFAETFDITPPKSEWVYVDVRGQILVGDADADSDGYGVDVLAVGGQEDRKFDGETAAHFFRPESLDNETFRSEFDPDLLFATTRNPDTALPEPFLPGSGLRGPLRHGFSRLLRAHAGDATAVRDPNVERTEREDKDLAETLFGTTEKSAALLVRDAHLAEAADWRAACMFHHAENEFTGGVYGSSLHSRAVVTRGAFDWRFVIEYREDPQSTKAVKEYLAAVIELGRIGHLPIGGAKWRGAGWPRWQVDRILWGNAGEDPLEGIVTDLAEVS